MRNRLAVLGSVEYAIVECAKIQQRGGGDRKHNCHNPSRISGWGCALAVTSFCKVRGATVLIHRLPGWRGQLILPLTQLRLASCPSETNGGKTITRQRSETARTNGVLVSSAKQAIRLVAILQTG